MATTEMNCLAGGGGSLSFVEGISELHWSSSVKSNYFNISGTTNVQDSYTGEYIKHTYNTGYYTEKACHIIAMKTDGTIIDADFGANETIFTYTYSSIPSNGCIYCLAFI